MLRVTLIAVLATAPLVAGSCSCTDRPLDDDREAHGEPACLWLISPYAFRGDGTAKLLYDEARGQPATVCLCLTEEEFDSLGDRLERVPEEGSLLEEFNELAYEECKRLSALVEGVVDDECLDFYEDGEWLKDIYLSEGSWDNGEPPGFTCYE